ncbi:hypothetical protein [Streptomyces jeddahensis]
MRPAWRCAQPAEGGAAQGAGVRAPAMTRAWMAGMAPVVWLAPGAAWTLGRGSTVRAVVTASAVATAVPGVLTLLGM